MDKFSYNSYPDSTESSPRAREIEFDNPPPWEDQQQSFKVKFMCSYGGKIQPRPHDNQLTYVNGDTKIMSVERGIRFPALVSKLSAVCGGGEISFKYQLPGEDLDALISVTNDDDLEHMMHEYDRLHRISSKPARMRLFLFPSSPSISGGFGSEGSIKSERDTLNPIPSRPESEKSVTASPNNSDFLFGSEKVAPAPPSPSAVRVPQPMSEPVALEPPMFGNQQVTQPDHPAEIQRQIQEFQRIQIRDQEQQEQQMQYQQQQQMQEQQEQQMQYQQQQQMQHQQQQQMQQHQQEAMYRRNSEDGQYFSPTYAQTPAPTTMSQTNQQPPIGYWQGNNNNNIPGNIYSTTSTNLTEQQVYMIPAQTQAPGTLYHSVMRPTAQGNQGYYPPVQRIQHHQPDAFMEQQNQPGYNVVQQQPPYSGGPQFIGGSGPMGLQETTPYSQMGKPLYYTVAGEGMMVPPPQAQPLYQGMGQPVSGMTDQRTGTDAKVMVNMAPQVSQSSDSV